MRSVLLVAHTSRHQIRDLATQATQRLVAAGFEVWMLPDEAAACTADTRAPDERLVRVVDPIAPAEGAELVLVLGGDGTFLRATELARPARVPMLGVNLGHVGFLAEAEPENLAGTVDAIVSCAYTVEERVTVDAEVSVDGEVRDIAWALNEVSLERLNRERMLEVAVAVDGRAVLRFGCDGVLCATPTGSTAYAFSVGGPIVWPNVDAFIVVPNAAHATFARPLVVAPGSVVDIDVISPQMDATLSCDGRRSVDVPSGSRVRVRTSDRPVLVARLGGVSFAERLVHKFQLPVRSLREGMPPRAGDPGLP
jgi:NAD+ kinase